VTPNLAIVEINAPHWHMPRLWLPLFLLWIPALLLAPLVILVLIAASIAYRVSLWRAIAVLWGVLCSLPGIDVRVATDEARVNVKIL
jgi:hypothetical protein